MIISVIKKNNSSISFNESNGEIAELIINGHSLLKNKEDSTWPRVWPIMFPFCGRLYKNEFKLNNEIYKINEINGQKWENKLHGFYDQLKWSTKIMDNKLICKSINTIEKKVWPHDFSIIHTLEILVNKVNIKTEIKNNGNNIMYFNYGHHGAFELRKNNPIIKTSKDGLYKKYTTKYSTSEDGETLKTNEVKINDLDFDNGIFYQDVNYNSNFVKIPKDGFNIKLKTNGFDTFTISKTDNNRSWIYMEFWKGFQDFENDSNKDISKKPQILSLKSGQTEVFNISIGLERD